MIITSVNSPSMNSGTGNEARKVQVSDSSTEIVAANTTRISVYIVNVGMHDVWLSCDIEALLGKGILLSNQGGSMSLDSTSFTTGAINAICSGGSSSEVSLQEFSR